HDLDLLEVGELGGRDVHLVEKDLPGLAADAADGGIADGARLLKNLLEHEVLVPTLFGHDWVPQNMLDLAVEGLAVEVGEADAFWGEDGHVAVHEKEHVAGVVQNGRDVGGHEVLVVAETDHGRRSGTDRYDLIGIAAGDDGQGEHAVDLLDGGADGGLQGGILAVVILFDQVGDDFGVGLGDEAVAL